MLWGGTPGSIGVQRGSPRSLDSDIISFHANRLLQLWAASTLDDSTSWAPQCLVWLKTVQHARARRQLRNGNSNDTNGTNDNNSSTVNDTATNTNTNTNAKISNNTNTNTNTEK